MPRPRRASPRIPSKLESDYAMQCRSVGLPEPVRELVFAPPRKWRADFAWPHYRLLVEIEGGTWVAGRHTRGSGFEKDAEKYNSAALQGWTVLRFTKAWIQDGRAIEFTKRALSLPELAVRTIRLSECTGSGSGAIASLGASGEVL